MIVVISDAWKSERECDVQIWGDLQHEMCIITISKNHLGKKEERRDAITSSYMHTWCTPCSVNCMRLVEYAGSLNHMHAVVAFSNWSEARTTRLAILRFASDFYASPYNANPYPYHLLTPYIHLVGESPFATSILACGRPFGLCAHNIQLQHTYIYIHINSIFKFSTLGIALCTQTQSRLTVADIKLSQNYWYILHRWMVHKIGEPEVAKGSSSQF